ncbi:MAG: hypothetical protein P8L68_19515 [Paracoccaceae bacterium]|nr:hypothetical protein [Paracoccaceae bacterium]
MNGWCPKSLASGISADALGRFEPKPLDAAVCTDASTAEKLPFEVPAKPAP